MDCSHIRSCVELLESEALRLLQVLIRTPSVTGQENKIQGLISAHFQAMGLSVEEWNPVRKELEKHRSFSDDGLPLGERPVVVGQWKGSGGGRSLILNGHVDVVPAGDEESWKDGPWSGVFREGSVWGRGSCDMKGGLVSAIWAVAALRKAGASLKGNVWIQSVIGEETGGVGTLSAIVRGDRADAAVILEPTRLCICPVGAGAASFRLKVPGRSAHGAMRLEGVSAVEKFIPVFQAIYDLENERNRNFRHELFSADRPAAPISIGKVMAGDWPSTVPECLFAEGRYGILPGESIQSAREMFERAIFNAAASDPWLSENPVEVIWFEGQFEPASTLSDAAIVQVIRKAHFMIRNEEPRIHGVPYGSDLRFFTNDAKMAAVLYGPGDVALAHSIDERVPWTEVKAAAEVIASTVLLWCGEEKPL